MDKIQTELERKLNKILDDYLCLSENETAKLIQEIINLMYGLN